MVTRRRFLGAGGLGILGLSSGFESVLTTRTAQGEVLASDFLSKKAQLRPFKNRLLGYPINMSEPAEAFMRWRSELQAVGIAEIPYNNVGNPFKPSPIPFNTHDFERELITSFAERFGFQSGSEWGFLSHSGTDSNMHGMYMGRTLLQARTNAQPFAYFTREAHYSVQILRDLLGIRWVEVQTMPDGGMDPNDLARKIADHPDSPALVVATVGTTFKGAVDNVEGIAKALLGTEHYLHVDAALFGGYLPYTKFASEVASQFGDGTVRYGSIAVSCHKFFGFPSPAGLFITNRQLYDEFNSSFSQIHNPEYIHQVPGTITCSRDAVKPAEFYYFTTPGAIEQQRSDAAKMLGNTDYLIQQMNQHLPQLAAVRSNPMSNTIYFRHPGEQVVKKYSLATMTLDVEKRAVKHAHAIIMPHVSRKILDEFLEDLETKQPRKAS